MDIINIARVCHEVNAAYCRSCGDNSQLPWAEAPSWQRDSAVAGVKFLLDNPGAGPGACHASWLAVKRADGWVYGAVKDAVAKRHPCMLDFTNLPKDQQTKDHLFVAVVRACQYSNAQIAEFFIGTMGLAVDQEKTVSTLIACAAGWMQERDTLRVEKAQLIETIFLMNEHEGSEGWSEDLKLRIKAVLP